MTERETSLTSNLSLSRMATQIMGHNTKGSVSEKGGSFLSSWATVSFLMTLLDDVNYFACFQRKILVFDSEPHGSVKTYRRFGKHCN